MYPSSSIIVPIYNAYEELILCVRSILNHTDFERTTLILIDDKSTDERIAPYLAELAAQEHPGVIVLTNERNMGFVKTVNRGVSQTKTDIVLLNSDTIVTKGWLERLAIAAYRDPSVATVTPMSNNASHCTIHLEQKNLDIDRLGERLYTASLHDYPEIGVGVGFCMYIKRSAWEDVGELDEKAYRKGYGEEVDFCLRCQQLGYRNILCDDAFVYHKGTASFTEAYKLHNIQRGEQILQKRYGEQAQSMLNTAERVRHADWVINAELYGAIENGHKNLLYLVQADFREDAQNNIGGTQFHVKDLMTNLKDTYNIFVAARDGDYLRFTAYIGERRFSFKFFIDSTPAFPIYHLRSMRELWDDLLSAFEINVVHIHHTFSLTLDLYNAAHDRGLPLIATLHDFYTICPSINLLENGERLCIGRETEDMCRKCMQNLIHIDPKLDLISKWRDEHVGALLFCDALILPSESAKRIFEIYYPQLAERMTVIPHGYENLRQEADIYDRFEVRKTVRLCIESTSEEIANGHIAGWCYLENCESMDSHLFVALTCDQTRILVPVTMFDLDEIASIDLRYRHSGFNIHLPVTNLHQGKWTIKMAIQNDANFALSETSITFEAKAQKGKKRLHIAFIGGISHAKGSQTVCTMIKQGPKSINWYVIGGIGDRDLAYLEQDNLFKTSWYRREDLRNLLDLYQIDMVCIPSLCPETFCYTLSEAVFNGRPVLTTDLGALGERVRKMDCGWTVPVEDCAKHMLNKVDEILHNPKLLVEKTLHVKELQHKTTAEMAKEYIDLYEKFTVPEKKRYLFNARRIYEGYLLGEKIRGRGLNDNSFAVDMQIRIDALEHDLDTIHASTAYKIAIAMRKIKFPFKRQIKVVMLKVYKLLKRKKMV